MPPQKYLLRKMPVHEKNKFHPGFTCMFLPIAGRKYLVNAPKPLLIHVFGATFLNYYSTWDVSQNCTKSWVKVL